MKFILYQMLCGYFFQHLDWNIFIPLTLFIGILNLRTFLSMGKDLLLKFVILVLPGSLRSWLLKKMKRVMKKKKEKKRKLNFQVPIRMPTCRKFKKRNLLSQKNLLKGKPERKDLQDKTPKWLLLNKAKTAYQWSQRLKGWKIWTILWLNWP